MRIPTDYIERYEAARGVDSEMADNYIGHTHIGDPEGDALVEALAPFGQEEQGLIIQAGMERNEEVLRDAPQAARDFFESIETPPDWVDLEFVRCGRANVSQEFAARSGGVRGRRSGRRVFHETSPSPSLRPAA